MFTGDKFNADVYPSSHQKNNEIINRGDAGYKIKSFQEEKQ